MLRAAIGYERHRGGEEFFLTTTWLFEDSNGLSLCILAAGETGNDVEHLMSTRVSVVFVLVGEFKFARCVDVPTGDSARGDCNVPLSSAGKIFVRVLEIVRWDVDGDEAKSPLRKNDGILNDDEIDDDVPELVDDWSIWVRKAFSVDELTLSFPIKKKRTMKYLDILLMAKKIFTISMKI